MPADTGPRAPDSPPATTVRADVPTGGWRRLAGRCGGYRLLVALAGAVFATDQATKYWIVGRLPYNPLHGHGAEQDIAILPGFLHLIHVGNTGAAWSIFTGRSTLLALLAAATLVAIFLWRHALGLRARPAQLCFGLLCGGIAGNLVDRLLHGHVVDFVDLHFGHYVYPTFNVADSAISIGVFLYLWQTLLKRPRGGQTEKPSDPEIERPGDQGPT
jgi:signal peptidase II